MKAMKNSCRNVHLEVFICMNDNEENNNNNNN